MESDIEIGDLRIFLAVAKQPSFTRAGQEVHLSQPAISLRIRQFEEALGVKLFEQTGKKVALILPKGFDVSRILETWKYWIQSQLRTSREVALATRCSG